MPQRRLSGSETRDLLFNFSRKLSFTEKLNVWARVVLWGFSWSLLMIFIYAFTGVDFPERGVGEASDPSLLRYMLFALVVAPVWEEIVFRAIPLRITQCLVRHFVRPVQILAFLAIIAATSFLFGFLHGGIIFVGIQGFTGLLYAYLYMRTGMSVRWAIAAHSAHNMLALLLIFMW